MKSIFKKESLIMTLVLFFYGFIAGGSVDFLFDGTFWTIIGILTLIIIVVVLCWAIPSAIRDEKKIEKLKKDFYSQETDIDLTRKIELSNNISSGYNNIYIDKTKRKMLVVSITSNGIEKKHIDGFVETYMEKMPNSYCFIDENREKALLVIQRPMAKLNYKLVEYGNCNKNKDSLIRCGVKTLIHKVTLPYKTKEDKNNPLLPTIVLIDEKYGFITVFKGLISYSFNYIKEDYITKKTGNKAYVTVKNIGSYLFVLDEYFKVLIIISPLISTYKVFNYSSIINVVYEEDGNTLFSKSMKRTIGGAIVGDILMGGAGAIVGGLSGETKQFKEVKSMNIKILIRNTTTPSLDLPINLKGETFNTKDEKSKKTYNTRIQEANAIKDLISVIIDNSSQQSTTILTSSHQINEEPKSQTGIADELVKLAQLKDAGVLSEGEFQQQKKKLLS